MKLVVYLFLAILLLSCTGNNDSTSQGSNLNPQNILLSKTTGKCNVGKTSNTTATSVVPYTIGGTYDSMSDYPANVQTCLNAATDIKNISILNPKALFNFNEEQSLQSVENALGVNLSVTVGWGKFAVTATTNYAKSSQDDAYTLNVNYIYKYAGTAAFNRQTSLQGTSALTPNALNVLASPTEFRQMCGDNFVAQMNAGASVLFRLTLKFNSSVEKNYYTDSLTKITGLGNVLDIIEANPNGVHYSLSASGIQVGGNPELFNQMFTMYGGGINKAGYDEINCGASPNVNPACAKIVNQLLAYPATIESQLNTANSLYLSNPVIAPWASIGVYPGAVAPNQDVMSAMQQLTQLYDEDQYTYLFINDYQNMLKSESFLSAQMQQDLLNLSALYEQILSIYLDPNSHIMDCYEGFVSTDCLAIRDSIVHQRDQILGLSPSLINLLAYLENSRYLAKLQTGSTSSAQCMLAPITNESGELYLVNCNGQVSGSFESAAGIGVIAESGGSSLKINNLNYSYIVTGSPANQFSYIFNGVLIPDLFYSGSYDGQASWSMNGTAHATSAFLLSKMF